MSALFDGMENRPFIPTEYVVRLARTPWERAGYHALRREVFCSEQQIFTQDDRDTIDEVAIPIIAACCMAGMADRVVGAVRIHEGEPGVWRGSRLAVHADHRKLGRIGGELIRMAVSTAHGLGAMQFLAQVQEQNVLFFRRLHWKSLGVITLHGLPHHDMEADLSRYPAHGLDQTWLLRPQPRNRQVA
ncbi:histone acetyltransferase [Acetobacter lambici]|uniref:Histone acetyltransferase n=1 Tax=Acetobacter lambici TaxID=1332824 RepID=A0ABT1F6C2_9PROT|nr:MSMEG_0567/Sll0786 family nitrogen starvation N-acetyltransferase [Acetobacter lambici]MCP1243336.1 histone acetyltransferase [Acetobacter lambici]MCP1259289.1 histone acetyltransferase [Acetobacter lambici]NHO57526.1 histone acetyltransferase [Acetobacter lambici]